MVCVAFIAVDGGPLRCDTGCAVLARGEIEQADVLCMPGVVSEIHQLPALEALQVVVDGAQDETGTAGDVDGCSGCADEGGVDDGSVAAQTLTAGHGVVCVDGEAGS